MKTIHATILLTVGLSSVGAYAVAQDTQQQAYYGNAEHSSTGLPPGHFKQIAAAADQFLNGPNRVLFSASLADGVNDPTVADELDDFYVLDVRANADFCAGHIAGATNFPFESVAKRENLQQLPTIRPILVVCYTGQKAGQVMTILNLLGFDAWSLHFGMMGWRASTPMKVGSSTGSPQTIYGAGLPTVTCP